MISAVLTSHYINWIGNQKKETCHPSRNRSVRRRFLEQPYPWLCLHAGWPTLRLKRSRRCAMLVPWAGDRPTENYSNYLLRLDSSPSYNHPYGRCSQGFDGWMDLITSLRTCLKTDFAWFSCRAVDENTTEQSSKGLDETKNARKSKTLITRACEPTFNFSNVILNSRMMKPTHLYPPFRINCLLSLSRWW